MTKIKNKLFTVAVLATSTFAVTALSVSSVLAHGGWQVILFWRTLLPENLTFCLYRPENQSYIMSDNNTSKKANFVASAL